jgi:hypothetical protein
MPNTKVYFIYSVFSELDMKPVWLSGNATDLYQECPVWILVGILGILTEHCLDFPQSFQAEAGMVP